MILDLAGPQLSDTEADTQWDKEQEEEIERASMDLGQELRLPQKKKPCPWFPVEPTGHHQQIINLCHRVWSRHNTPCRGFKFPQDGIRKRSVSDFPFLGCVTKHDIFNGISPTRVNSWASILTF